MVGWKKNWFESFRNFLLWFHNDISNIENRYYDYVSILYQNVQF